MMDIYTIRSENRKAAARAAKAKREPFVVDSHDAAAAKDGDTGVFRSFPYFGGYLPRGWKRVRLTEGRGVYMGDNVGFGAYMVDSSGFGRPGEPALTIGEFSDKLEPGFGYAIVSAGQFQVKIGKFKKALTSPV